MLRSSAQRTDPAGRPEPAVTKSRCRALTFVSPAPAARAAVAATMSGSMSSAKTVPDVRRAAGMAKVP